MSTWRGLNVYVSTPEHASGIKKESITTAIHSLVVIATEGKLYGEQHCNIQMLRSCVACYLIFNNNANLSNILLETNLH